jgi:hypothetical protein
MPNNTKKINLSYKPSEWFNANHSWINAESKL